MNVNKIAGADRLIGKHVEDLFILEVFCCIADEFKYYTLDSLGESEFHAAFGSIIEETSHRHVVREASGAGEFVCTFVSWHRVKCFLFDTSKLLNFCDILKPQCSFLHHYIN